MPSANGGRGEAGVFLVDALDVIRWGTAGGAAILGLPSIGTLEIGKAADLAIYDLSSDPRHFGQLDPLISPVVAAGSARLRSLLVGGREVVSNSQLSGFDLRELSRQAGDAVRALKSRTSA